jgi:hypothetical protein
MLAYLAGPLDGVSHEDGREWYKKLEALAPPGWVLYLPGHAFASPASDAIATDAANRSVIVHAASVVIANLSGPGRGFGTIREIEFARQHGRPVVVIGELDSLLAHDVECVARPEDVWPYIIEQIDRQTESMRDNPIVRLFEGLSGNE